MKRTTQAIDRHENAEGAEWGGVNLRPETMGKYTVGGKTLLRTQNFIIHEPENEGSGKEYTKSRLHVFNETAHPETVERIFAKSFVKIKRPRST